MTLYGFFYNSCIYESAHALISIHKTKDGADKALVLHKEMKRGEWQILVDSDEDKGTDMGYEVLCPFGDMEDWHVREVELKD